MTKPPNGTALNGMRLGQRADEQQMEMTTGWKAISSLRASFAPSLCFWRSYSSGFRPAQAKRSRTVSTSISFVWDVFCQKWHGKSYSLRLGYREAGLGWLQVYGDWTSYLWKCCSSIKPEFYAIQTKKVGIKLLRQACQDMDWLDCTCSRAAGLKRAVAKGCSSCQDVHPYFSATNCGLQSFSPTPHNISSGYTIHDDRAKWNKLDEVLEVRGTGPCW